MIRLEDLRHPAHVAVYIAGIHYLDTNPEVYERAGATSIPEFLDLDEEDVTFYLQKVPGTPITYANWILASYGLDDDELEFLNDYVTGWLFIAGVRMGVSEEQRHELLVQVMSLVQIVGTFGAATVASQLGLEGKQIQVFAGHMDAITLGLTELFRDVEPLDIELAPWGSPWSIEALDESLEEVAIA